MSKSKYFIIGSSTRLAPALSKELGDAAYFLGRSNPHELSQWYRLDDYFTVEDVYMRRDEVMRYIEANLNDTESLHILFLAGVSTNDWLESVLVNEIFPAIVGESFIDLVADEDTINDASIVLVGTTGAYQGAKITYSATKASLTGILHTFNRRSPEKVRANLVIPSAFDSGMIADWDVEKRRAVAATTRVGRLGKPEEIADALLFAARNKFLADSIVNVSGGQIAIE